MYIKKFSKNVYIKRKDFIPECLVSGRTVWWSSSLFKYLCIQGKIYLKGDGCQKRHFRYIIIYSTYSNNRTVWNSGMYRRKNFLKISNNCTWPSWFCYSTLSTRLGFLGKRINAYYPIRVRAEFLIYWLNLFLDSTGKFSSTSSRGQTFKKHYLARKSSYWCCYTFTADNQRSFGAFLSSTLRYTNL